MAAAAFQALGVCVELADACAALGWKAPTEIQAQAIPLALAGAQRAVYRHTTVCLTPGPGKDVIGLAQTGSGKTGAFALPILQVCVWEAHEAALGPAPESRRRPCWTSHSRSSRWCCRPRAS